MSIQNTNADISHVHFETMSRANLHEASTHHHRVVHAVHIHPRCQSANDEKITWSQAKAQMSTVTVRSQCLGSMGEPLASLMRVLARRLTWILTGPTNGAGART